MFHAGFSDFTSQRLGNFGGFSNRTPLCDEAGDVGARGYESPFFQRLNMKTNGDFIHIFALILAQHYRIGQFVRASYFPSLFAWITLYLQTRIIGEVITFARTYALRIIRSASGRN